MEKEKTEKKTEKQLRKEFLQSHIDYHANQLQVYELLYAKEFHPK